MLNMATSVDFKSLASVEGADTYQEAAIIIPGPPVEVFAQRAAPTVVMKSLQQTNGKFYYECKTATGGYMQLGWADTSFRAVATEGKGCGDDPHSWAYDGYRCLKWTQNKKDKYGKRWKAGDVIGMAVDIDNKTVSFSLNGEWENEMGLAFTGVNFEGGVYPCMTLLRGERVQINIGTTDNPFIYSPLKGYKILTVTEREGKPEELYSRYSSFANVIRMGLSESSFDLSFPGEIMVEMMQRGLDYEAKKNAMIHAGYEETIKRWKVEGEEISAKLEGTGLNKDEIFAVICYTLEKPPVYRYFNNDTRKGYGGDGMDYPILSHLLREACRKLLASVPIGKRTKIVYRGVGLPFAAEVGQIVRFGSYTSTTGNEEVAADFQEDNPSGTEFIITTKIGASIKTLSAFPEEDEVLVPPYEIFRITKVEKSPIRIYLESGFDDEYVDRYVADKNAVYESRSFLEKLKNMAINN